MAFDPELAIADAQFQSHTEALAYVRSFDLRGQPAKFDVICPAVRRVADAIARPRCAAASITGGHSRRGRAKA